VPVEVSDEMRLGVVCLPYGWGHDAPGARLRVAEGRPGVNTNLLTDGDVLDAVSGNATLNGIPVTVTRP
jgi:anaerobic selenocysteine-containing dehydrogenase